jgi:Zn-dependent protease
MGTTHLRSGPALEFLLHGGLPLGRIGNTRLKLHWTMFLGAGILSAVVSPVAACVLYGSTFLHELGHLAAARHHGFEPDRLLIHGLGGFVTLPEGMGDGQVMWTALAGPATNLALAGLALGAAPYLGWSWLRPAAYLNTGLAAVNLLPMFGLDGGIALQRGVASRWGEAAAQRVGLVAHSVAEAVYWFFLLTRNSIMPGDW